MLFELLTGEQPHTGETPLAVAYKHVNEVVPAPSQLVDGSRPRSTTWSSWPPAGILTCGPRTPGSSCAAVTEVRLSLPPAPQPRRGPRYPEPGYQDPAYPGPGYDALGLRCPRLRGACLRGPAAPAATSRTAGRTPPPSQYVDDRFPACVPRRDPAAANSIPPAPPDRGGRGLPDVRPVQPGLVDLRAPPPDSPCRRATGTGPGPPGRGRRLHARNHTLVVSTAGPATAEAGAGTAWRSQGARAAALAVQPQARLPGCGGAGHRSPRHRRVVAGRGQVHQGAPGRRAGSSHRATEVRNEGFRSRRASRSTTGCPRATWSAPTPRWDRG